MFGDKNKKRRRSIFDDLFEEMREFMEEVEKMFMRDFDFEDFERIAPKIRTPSGMEVRGPFVWGWSVTIGPDGKPRIQEFGNVPKHIRPIEEKEEELIKPVREPLVDIIEDKDKITVIAELPGVEKDEIDIRGTSKTLEIKAADQYYKKIDLPAEVDPNNAKSTYKNGILEIVLPKLKKEKSNEETKIKIE
ncbi:MAG: archaeal heat shock protein Hsp20 [Candidatus Asgardarchaeia archaeon]